MRDHEAMRHWASITRPAVGPRPKPATQKLQEAIAERREHQKVLAQNYAERRREAAAAARDFRDRVRAVQLAKAAEKGITYDENGQPMLTITPDAGDDQNP